jgi:hypothetical protein
MAAGCITAIQIWCKYILISLPLGPELLCGLVVSVPGYRSKGPGSILGDTKFTEK